MRVADFIAGFLADRGVRHVFLITGGGAMHLNDAIGRENRLQYICNHHEQACAMAAESYFRLTNRPAVVNVTTGPGATNAITGVYGAYVDSMAMVVLSGQVKWETSVGSTGLPLRQLGDQEVDIVHMVEGITKYAALVADPQTIRYHLERAMHLSTHGRPGPVWLDVPSNVQATQIEPEVLEGYDPAEDAISYETKDLAVACGEILARLARAERPLIYAGSGVRLAGQNELLIQLAERLGVPMVAAWNSNDLIADDHPLNAGRPGSVGDRAGNFAVQNADVLLILGCRLNIRLVSYNWENFAPRAWKAWVDVDAAELRKPTVKPDLPVHADLRDFLPRMMEVSCDEDPARHRDWAAWCRERRQRYPVVLPEYWQTTGGINPYCFVERLFDRLGEDEVIVTGDGTACVTVFQAGRVRRQTRMFHNSGCAPMGYDLPAAIGAAVARGGRNRVVCVAGDGSIMMNLQELQTISGMKLPVKTFVLNNGGYHSIRQTQQNFFPDNVVGCGADSGVTFPDWERVAAAFGMPFQRAASHADLDSAIRATLEADGPAFCEVVLDLNQPFAPKLSSRKLPGGAMVTASLEDMSPFLSRAELDENMLFPPNQP